MTEEEMAEKYVKQNHCEFCIMADDCESGCIDCFTVQAYIAGLKAGRPEWHDLRKDPTDLPERVSSTSPISKTVVNQIGTPCYYHYGLKCWHNWSFIKIATPIAWCEVPTFTDKE